jgi:GTPase
VHRAGDQALVAQGGRGGRGNQAFKTALNRAPTIAENGEAGVEKWIALELKLVADVGIIGVPNAGASLAESSHPTDACATICMCGGHPVTVLPHVSSQYTSAHAGKSTLLSVLSSAKPKVANYAFTTLVPNLGVCELDYQTTVFADVPGLVEGAHTGEGLGHEFLRHVSRARTLVHIIDGTSADPIYDYRAIRLELQLFDGDLEHKPQLIAYNKIDVPDSGDYVNDVKELLAVECGVDPASVYPISSATGEGVLDLVRCHAPNSLVAVHPTLVWLW